MLVDDDEDMRTMYAYGLSAMGFEVLAIDDGGRQAHARASDVHPDIIVTELALRGGDGWTVVQDLKQDAGTRDIPIVVITHHRVESVRERARREGCAALCLKPCLPDTLAAGLRAVLEQKNLLRERASCRD
jgi:CheY-like chemotaxis protein